MKGGKVENKNKVFKFLSDIFCLFFFFFKRIPYQKKEWDDGFRKGVLSQICQKDGIQGGGNLYKSSHDCSLNEERKFNIFFSPGADYQNTPCLCKEVFC